MTLFSTLRRSTKPINRVSAKRNQYEADLDRMRPFVNHRSGGWCEARLIGVCTGRAHAIHHRRARGRLGDNDLSNLLSLCSRCHEWTHANPILASAWGLLVASHEDPAEVPVLAGMKP